MLTPTVRPGPPQSPGAAGVDLLEALEQTWRAICDEYDVVADLPDMRVLLKGADLTAPERAAETVLANMLLEARDGISRFSPWHLRPLGLRLVREGEPGRSYWALSPKARQQWQQPLGPLTRALRGNLGLALAADLLEGLDEPAAPADCVLATCLCVPPRLIRVKRAVFMASDIMCDSCQRPFRPVEPLTPRDA